jgi:hypothetical protein
MKDVLECLVVVVLYVLSQVFGSSGLLVCLLDGQSSEHLNSCTSEVSEGSVGLGKELNASF